MTNPCETCRYWVRGQWKDEPHYEGEIAGKSSFGVCRRFPAYVDKKKGDTCGEWKDFTLDEVLEKVKDAQNKRKAK